MLKRLIQIIFFVTIIRPIVFVIIGLNIRHRDRLPKNGSALIVANHNSHLDTLVLMSLFPIRMLHLIRPIAAKDYFSKRPLINFFARNCMNVLYVDRAQAAAHDHFNMMVKRSLSEGQIIILFPEGTRGTPELLQRFKKGIAHIAQQNENVPLFPVFLAGLGKSLPKGEALFVPFFCDVSIGQPIYSDENIDVTLAMLESAISKLASECNRSE